MTLETGVLVCRKRPNRTQRRHFTEKDVVRIVRYALRDGADYKAIISGVGRSIREEVARHAIEKINLPDLRGEFIQPTFNPGAIESLAKLSELGNSVGNLINQAPIAALAGNLLAAPFDAVDSFITRVHEGAKAFAPETVANLDQWIVDTTVNNPRWQTLINKAADFSVAYIEKAQALFERARIDLDTPITFRRPKE